MLADHIETEVLGLLNIKLESLVCRSCVKPVRPPALVERTKLEQATPIQAHQKGVAVLPVG